MECEGHRERGSEDGEVKMGEEKSRIEGSLEGQSRQYRLGELQEDLIEQFHRVTDELISGLEQLKGSLPPRKVTKEQ